MQTRTRKVISISPEKRQKLMDIHNCSYSMVYSALAYKTNSKKARAIQKDALKRFGGIEIDKPVFN